MLALLTLSLAVLHRLLQSGNGRSMDKCIFKFPTIAHARVQSTVQCFQLEKGHPHHPANHESYPRAKTRWCCSYSRGSLTPTEDSIAVATNRHRSNLSSLFRLGHQLATCRQEYCKCKCRSYSPCSRPLRTTHRAHWQHGGRRSL